MALERNMHTIDRAARIIVGLACVYIGFFDKSMIGNDLISALVGVFGVVNVGAAILLHCPVYRLAGISSYRAPEA